MKKTMPAALFAVLILFAVAAHHHSSDAQSGEVPGPISNLSLSAKAKRVTVSWTAPTTGGAVENYIVNIRPQGGGNGHTKRPPAGKTSVTFKRLSPGAEYEVFVRGKNSAGKGDRVYARISTQHKQQLQGGSDDPQPTPTYAPGYVCLGPDGKDYNLPGVCFCLDGDGSKCGIATFTPTPEPA